MHCALNHSNFPCIFAMPEKIIIILLNYQRSTFVYMCRLLCTKLLLCKQYWIFVFFFLLPFQTELSQALTSLSEKAKSAKDFLVHLKNTIDQVQVGVRLSTFATQKQRFYTYIYRNTVYKHDLQDFSFINSSRFKMKAMFLRSCLTREAESCLEVNCGADVQNV